VELLGVGAYLGGTGIIADRTILQVAGTILTVEARHQTVLNALNAATTVPSAFDIPLSPPQVLAIAGVYISGCDIGITGMRFLYSVVCILTK
jgi:Ferritin-like domain